ncbi:acylphosphatase [bacterium]|nr:acylphosphatase [bacterium]MCB1221463.1 acylphosphatase [bacterium]UNM09350.1 MAG: acylphosphatase [Planctomycetales bacterium]
MAGPISIRVTVTGKVQGVFYRATVRDWAAELKIHGWVKNEPDGSVVAVIQHMRQPVLDEMLKRMWQGPKGALVLKLHSEKLENHLQYSEFSILR